MIFLDVKTLAHVVRQVRKKQGLTQEQLSAASGIGVRFIRELEQGKESCHIGKVFQIVHMLGIILKVEGSGVE